MPSPPGTATPPSPPARMRRKSGRPLNYSRTLLDDAVADILSRKSRGKSVSVREAAERFKVPKSTLHRHLKLASGRGGLTTSATSAPAMSPPRKSCIPFLLHDSSSSSPPRDAAPIPCAPGCACADAVLALHTELRHVRATVARLERVLATPRSPPSAPPPAVSSPVSTTAAHSDGRSASAAPPTRSASPPPPLPPPLPRLADDGFALRGHRAQQRGPL